MRKKIIVAVGLLLGLMALLHLVHAHAARAWRDGHGDAAQRSARASP
jgi:hypothetical protein